jgi:hypothetical protein
MTERLYVLRITRITNQLLADMRGWRPRAWLRFTAASEQEPTFGFGNFNTWDPSPLSSATFYTTSSDAERGLTLLAECTSGVEAEIVCYQEAGR